MVSNLNNWPAPRRRLLLPKIGSFCGALLLLAQLALAGEPAPYGEYLVRLGGTWPDGGTVARSLEAAAVSAATNSASFKRQLSQLEEDGGPYADALAQPLADLARFYLSTGDIEQAQREFRRALHIVRINEGLYSERQIPILRELFEIYRMNGDMATLDARYDYFFRLYGSGLPPYTPVRIGAALEYLRWQREAVRLELDEQDAQRLLAMYTLNQRMLDDLVAAQSVDFSSYQLLVLSQLRNLYLLKARYKPGVEAVSFASGASAPAVWGETDTNRQRLETYQRNALERGRRLLQDFISRMPAERVEDLAAAWLELADWNQWNDSRSQALAAYAEVVKILRDGGRIALLEQWLGQPLELPANGAFWQPRPIVEGREPIIVQATYDVSASGKAVNIEATALSSQYEGRAARFKRELRDVRFRPRMASGEPEAQTQLHRDYEVLQ